MNRAVTGLCIASEFGLVVTLGAQTAGQTTGTSGTPGQRTSSSRSDSTKDVTTVSGCLSKDASGNYTLNNAKIEPSGSGSSTSGTAGTTGTSAGTASGTTSGTSSSSPYGSSSSETWRLSGKSSDLDKHIGHKIQVTGKEMSSSSSTTASTGSTTSSTTGTTGTTTESSASHRLDVDSVKMVAASCS